MELINLTAHSIFMLDAENQIKTVIKPSGIVPKAKNKTISKEIITVDGLEIVAKRTKIDKVFDMPEPKESTRYIVADFLKRHFEDSRDDLLTIGNLIKDEQGKILGCKELIL